MTWISCLSCHVTLDPVVGIGKGSSQIPSLDLERGTLGHKSKTTQKVGSNKLDCLRDLRHCDYWVVIQRVKKLLQSTESSASTKHVARELKAICDTEERDKGEIKSDSDIWQLSL